MLKNEKEVIDKTVDYLKTKLSDESSGHDWWHAYRVWNNAKLIGRNENANMFIVELAALLHDIADWKFQHDKNETAGSDLIADWLVKLSVDTDVISQICQITKEVSFKGVNHENKISTIEGMIVQDADRLDAIGAIGIARNFMTGAKFNELMYDPNIPVPEYDSGEQYMEAKGKNKRTVINHFYEKSLFLKDLMNTEIAKKIAQNRHDFMEEFLEEFLKEWNGDS